MIRLAPLLLAIALLVGTVTFKGQIITAIKKEQFKNAPEASELVSKRYVDKILASNGRFDPTANKAIWFNKYVPMSNLDLAMQIAQDPRSVLGQDSDLNNKWIEVDLDKQRLYARQNGEIVYNMAVSTGLPWFPTVTGDFKLWAKVRSQQMTGGSVENGTYYDLPNVPFVQYFYNGYSLHGAYWHHDFGKPRSHGCVNLSLDDAKKLFEWTDPQMGTDQWAIYKINPDEATRIVIHGATPTTL